MTGTLNMADLAARLPEVQATRRCSPARVPDRGHLAQAGAVSAAPVAANAYTYAPSAVTAFLAATATKVSVYLLIRFFYSVFDTTACSPIGAARILMALSVRRCSSPPRWLSSRTT